MPLRQQRKTISQSEIIVDDKKPLQEEQFSDDISDEDNDIDEVFQDAYDFIPSSSIKMPSEFRDKSIALRSLRQSHSLNFKTNDEEEFKDCFDIEQTDMKLQQLY